MAILNFRIGNVTERGGKAARRVTQYLQREGEYRPREVAYLTRTSQDTVARGDYVTHAVGNLPDWAQGSATRFFAAAEAYERGGTERLGRWATTWQMALPVELSREEQWAMGHAFVAEHLKGHAYLIAMHDPVTKGQHQPHIHVLFSERVGRGEAPEKETYFRQPSAGGWAKDRWFSQRNSAIALRDAWADWMNYTLERAGVESRIHPRSLYEQGIDRPPEPKVGYSPDPLAHARRAAIRAQRDAAEEQARAASGWDARKRKLGVTDVRDLDPQQFLEEGYARARGQQPGQWNPALAAQKEARREQAHIRHQHARDARESALTEEIVTLERHLTRLTTEATLIAAHARQGSVRSAASERQTLDLLATGQALGLEAGGAEQRQQRRQQVQHTHVVQAVQQRQVEAQAPVQHLVPELDEDGPLGRGIQVDMRERGTRRGYGR